MLLNLGLVTEFGILNCKQNYLIKIALFLLSKLIQSSFNKVKR
jgi:hypothetical protein